MYVREKKDIQIYWVMLTQDGKYFAVVIFAVLGFKFPRWE